MPIQRTEANRYNEIRLKLGEIKNPLHLQDIILEHYLAEMMQTTDLKNNGNSKKKKLNCLWKIKVSLVYGFSFMSKRLFNFYCNPYKD